MEVTVTTMLMILGGMFATMLSAMIVSIRMQHRDNLATREVIADTNLATRQEATRQIERLGDKLSGEFAEHKRIVERNHGKVVESLGDARERLARIEGHLRVPPPPPPPPQPADPADQGDHDGDAKAA